MSYLWAWVVPCVLGYIFLSWIRRFIKIKDITKKHILVTGCDSGFGNLLAQRLDMMGCHVFAACLTESAKSRLQSVTSKRLIAFTMDVTSDEDVNQAADFVGSHLREAEGLWGLVNNAGVLGTVFGPVEWHTTRDFYKVCDVNTFGTIRVALAFLPLVKRAKGRIVNMASLSGRVANAYTLPYCVSQFAVEAFSDGLRGYLAQYGASVHIIEPGPFNTDFFDKLRLQKLVHEGWKRSPWSTKQEFGEDYYQKLLDWSGELADTGSPRVHLVIRAYLHALTAVSPRLRYSVGWASKFQMIPLSYMPSIVMDYVLSSSTKLPRPHSLKDNKGHTHAIGVEDNAKNKGPAEKTD